MIAAGGVSGCDGTEVGSGSVVADVGASEPLLVTDVGGRITGGSSGGSESSTNDLSARLYD